MRGILLAGGTGSRLWPITKAVSKQLMPVFDKPMVYYPLSTLLMAGISDVLVITTPQDQVQFERLLGDGSQWGIRIKYAAQPRPEGIAQAFLIGEEFIGDEDVALILGDNIFHGVGLGRQLGQHERLVGGRIFAYPVANPQEYGVVEFDETGKVLSIEEKPSQPRSRFVVPGSVLLRQPDRQDRPRSDPERPRRAGDHRGQRRIPAPGPAAVSVLDRGTAWLDTGTFNSLVQAAEYVRVIEERQGLKIGCVEEIAWRAGLHHDDQLRALAEPLLKSGYGQYLVGLLEEAGDTRCRRTSVVRAPG